MNPAHVEQVIRCIAIEGCLIVEAQFDHGKTVAFEQLSSPLLVITLSGGVSDTHDAAMRFRQSRCSFLPVGARWQALAPGQGWHVLLVELDAAWARELIGNLALDAPRSSSGAWTQRIAHRLYEELLSADSGTATNIRALVMLIATEIARAPHRARNGQPHWLESVRSFIECNYRTEIETRELARQARVHPAHLSKAFTRAFGYTLREYVRALRVEFARGQIESTTLTLSEIAMAAGFADQSHFTKTFKRVLGRSPSEYRQALKRSAVPDL